MKFIKNLLPVVLFLCSTASLLAQLPGTDRVVQGKKGRAIYIERIKGVGQGYLSGNEKYVFGSMGDNEGGFIYEIATGELKMYEGYGIIEVIDFDNYAASNHLVRNGVRTDYPFTEDYYLYGGASYATPDLKYITFDTRVGDKTQYVTVLLNEQGQPIDTMPHFDERCGPGYGSFVFALSADASVLVGRTSFEEAFSNFTPGIWDRTAKKTIGIIDTTNRDRKLDDGTLYSVTEDGTIATGEIEDHPYWVEYNKADQSYKLHLIEPLPGYAGGFGSHIRGKNILGTFDNDVYDRLPFLYNIETEKKVWLNDVLLYLYGLDLSVTGFEKPLFQTISMSADQRIFAGYSYDGSWIPYVILLDEEQIHPIVRNVTAKPKYGTANVEVRWEAPMEGNYTANGYKVYRDSVCIATLGIDKNEYTDAAAPSGTHKYQVQALYSDGEVSDYSAPIKLLVVGVDGCLPVRQLSSEVIYNRTVNLSWGLPSAQLSNKKAPSKITGNPEARVNIADARKAPLATKYMGEDKLDYVGMRAMANQYAGSAVRVGDYLYVGEFRENVIRVINLLNGKEEAYVRVQGLGGVFDMSYHNNMLYCVNGTKNVYELAIDEEDPFDISLSNTWTAKSDRLTHISYVEKLNGDKDVILTGGFAEMIAYNTNPVDADDIVADLSKVDLTGYTIIGSAYHKGRLYLANQHDGKSALIETFDWASGKHLFTTDLMEIPEVATLSAASQGYSSLSAGLNLGTLEDGTVVLDAMIQPLVALNHIITVEVESSPDVEGYNVYRDGKKVNTTPVKARHFSEKLFEPGKYQYKIEYVAKNGCTNNESVVDTVEIFPIGECEAPKSVEVYESNEQAVLSWSVPDNISGSGFVGFNVYCNGKKVKEDLLDTKYVDASIEKGRKYVYRVESFYDNSCVASDSVEIVPTFEGFAQAPSLVKATAKKIGDNQYTAATTWDLPYFEKPMSMGYCAAPAGALNLDGVNTIYAAIGWDANDLSPLKDLYLVGVEFIIGTEVRSVSGVVYVDDALVLEEPIDRVRVGDWHQYYFSRAIPMKQKVELAVGYAVSFVKEELTGSILVHDAGPSKPKYSDLVSPDGITFYTLTASGVPANLCINALVVRKRDLDNAAKMPDPQAYLKTKATKLASAVKLTEPVAFTGTKTTSESYTLQGFNVYRDNKKLNEGLLKNFKYEETVAEGAYEYMVSAVYADTEEIMSDPFFLEIVANSQADEVCPVTFSPNPVRDMLHIDGEYATLSLLDMSGRVLMSGISGTKAVSMKRFPNGIYFVKITAANGSTHIAKIVKK